MRSGWHKMEISNWINFGILFVTALVGVLCWLGARNAAREAREDQRIANDAAKRSASAAEEANTIQTRFVEIEESRESASAAAAEKAALAAKRAILTAQIKKRSPGSVLVIRNSGPACAREIEVLMNESPLNEYREFDTTLPAGSEIAPGGTLELPYVLFRNGKLWPPFHVALSWSDDSDQRGTWDSSLGY